MKTTLIGKIEEALRFKTATFSLIKGNDATKLNRDDLYLLKELVAKYDKKQKKAKKLKKSKKAEIPTNLKEGYDLKKIRQ